MPSSKVLVPPLTEPLLVFRPSRPPQLSPRWAMLFVDLCKEPEDNTKTLSGTHALRLTTVAEDEGENALFLETDRDLLYRSDGVTWEYVAGVMEVSLATVPTDLGTDDAGVRVHLSTYHHLLRWTGTAWDWADGDLGNGFYQEFHSAPPTEGWDLSTVAVDTTRLVLGATLTTESVRTRACVAQYDVDNLVYYRR